MTRYRATLGGKPVKLNVLPIPHEIERFRAFVHSAPAGILGFDVETTAIEDSDGAPQFDPAAAMRMIQFGSLTEAWCLDPHDVFWRPWIEKLLRWRKRRFVSHTSYDPLWARREFGIDLGERSIDTIILANLLDPGAPPVGQPKDLKSLTGRYIGPELQEAEAALHARMRELAPTGHRRGKQYIRWGFDHLDLSDPAFGAYAGLDSIAVRRLLDLLAAELPRGVRPLARREQAVARLSNEMQWRGQRLDVEYTREILEDVEHDFLEAEERLESVLGFKPRGPKLGPWLEERGVEFVALTDIGAPSLTKDTLPLLVARYGAEAEIGQVLVDRLTLSQRSNLLSNLRQILDAARHDGFVHSSINTMTAVTGRMSITGPAMQTFKKDDPRLRGCFIARDGYVLVGADYDSQELRLAAAYSRDRALLRIIRDGLKQHVVTAQLIFGERFRDKERDVALYTRAKVLNFAQQYGAGPATIGDQLGLPRGPRTHWHPDGEANPEAVALWHSWRTAYAGLVAWTERMSEQPVVVNPWGRRIPRDRWRHYANGNYLIQSSGRDLLGDAMVNCAKAGMGDWLWLPVHDELILEVPEDEAERAAKTLEECMYAEIREIEMTATASILGSRWNGLD